jgi:transposase
MQDEGSVVTGGVDTHADQHVAAVVDGVGRILGTKSFPATAAGYKRLSEWMASFGPVARIGVEGTGAYGAGLARFLAAQGMEVVEVDRPNRRIRRRRGKSDTTDAEAAARAALNGEASGVPKAADGPVEALRALRVARRSALKARTQATNQIRDLIVTAPEGLRAKLRALDSEQRIAACARLRPGTLADPTEATKTALRSLARRCQELDGEITQLDQAIATLCAQAKPALLGAFGVGADTASALLVAAGDNPERMRSEASFAALCGSSPVEASSGKVTRHWLNLGGNREANQALWRIVMVRLSHGHGPTIDYLQRRRKEGKSDREIIRCLKRFVAREIYQLITNPPGVPSGADLRAARQDAGLPLRVVAEALGTWPIRISQLERGLTHSNDLATRYSLWLEHTHVQKAA